MRRILLVAFVIITGFINAQVRKAQSTQKPKAEKKWVNPVKLTKNERNRPYMDEVLKTRDSLTPNEAERRRKNIAIGNPFAKYGVYPKIATLSKGKYLEFHDTDSIVVIGSVRYNSKRGTIIEIRKIDLSDPDAQPIGDTHGRWMSPDPLSEEFPDWSPYNYAINNPINNIDPTGLAAESVKDDYKLLKNGQVEFVKKTDDKFDRLYATDKKGNIDKGNSITVAKEKPTDGTIISDLSVNRSEEFGYSSPNLRLATTSNRTDALDVFQFAALNSVNEWSIASNTANGKTQYALGTELHPTLSPNFLAFDKLGFSSKTLNWDMHSHGIYLGTDGPSSGDTSHALSKSVIRYLFRTNGNERGRVYPYGKETINSSLFNQRRYDDMKQKKFSDNRFNFK